MTWKLVRSQFSRPGLDPYAHWLLGAGRADFLLPGEQRVPLLLRYPRIDSAESTGSEKNSSDQLSPEPRSPEADYVTEFVLVNPSMGVREWFEIISEKLKQGPARLTLGTPLPENLFLTERDDRSGSAAEPGAERAEPSPARKPGTVVVGIIDDAIPFAHERFRRADGSTRVEFVWIQEGLPEGPSDVEYGRELRKADIDALSAACTQAGAVDEDRLYQMAGAADFSGSGHAPLARRASHGAHVMDQAFGFEPDLAPDWPIVCVQLPMGVTADTSGGTLRPQAIKAVEYILKRAEKIGAARGEALPVVINFSYGFTAGSHDGTDELEAFLDDTVREHNETAGNRPLRVVIPSGNSHLARIHARVSFSAPKERVALPWRVQPDDRTPSFVEVWLPAGGPSPARLGLTLTPPDGPESPPLEEDATGVLQWEVAGRVLCEIAYHRVPAPTDRGMFLIALQPTERLEPAGPGGPVDLVAPAGTWTIALENVSLSFEEPVEAWIQRDEAPFGYPRRGRQSRFDHPCYQRFDHAGQEIEEDDPDCVIRRDGSINAIATGRETIVIGGLLRRQLRASRYSAGGPITTPVASPKPHRAGPDALAVSDDSVVHAGVLGAGTRSGSVLAMDGTSVAAPRVARWIAEQLAAGEPGGRPAVRQLALDEEAKLPPASKPPRRRGGAGRIGLPPVHPMRRFDDDG